VILVNAAETLEFANKLSGRNRRVAATRLEMQGKLTTRVGGFLESLEHHV
jgi:hypothetical protein